MVLKSRVFWRLCDKKGLPSSVVDLTDEVNQFIAQFTIGDVVDVKYEMTSIPINVGTQLCFVATVIYVE